MSATEYEIRAGDYTAVVTERAAALRRLTFQGRDLVVPFPQGGPIPDYRGVIAAPWPNRIRDGRYSFDGADYQVPVNEEERGCALHGFAFSQDWGLEARDDTSVVLSCTIEPTAGYPFALRLTAHYWLGEDGLHGGVAATNTGTEAAPYGVCPHPYLLAGPAPLDDWTLQVPARTFLEVTPDRLLPVRTRPVEGHEFDFRVPRAIGATEIDHAFTDIAFDDAGRASLTVMDPSGTGVGMAWDGACRWLQVHTADKKPPLPNNRIGLAVEPMTCPPDAFNSGTDLVRLEPGATHEADWRIFGVPS
ncbi:aldose 1-epimerase family protein [Paenarthrobacter sp. DKR-5]|uniref:aldose 1-epimerase family protein n=1 Tax=Paenarthrobacter sp. DKR-5 TaxID=2835535 RepID=UPI001BDCC1DA|nr:aldose 1-epimerase family protein [Paenarthrobacter sp. DKR-5]MBT1003337.1 aldose 1-epimerase family protein [Paenarthrobacter sp. DKR-5]